MKFAAIALSAFSLLSLTANADTYETFAISGTDSQRQQNLGLGQSGCTQLVCVAYAPGTFSGDATIDISTDTIVAASVTTCCGGSGFTESYTMSALTPNLSSGLDLTLPLISTQNLGWQPILSLGFDLSNDSVSGMVAGPQANIGPPIDQVGATYTLDMVGKLKLTTVAEINPASAAGMLTLLIGGLVVMRGRKHKGASA